MEKETMKLPRILLTAPASGSGKTLITCGLLQAFVNRKLRVASFKCGPDYIDPMFHTKVIGTPSRNLDTFFADRETVRYLFGRQAALSDLSVMEGVMGYFDGVAGTSLQASAYDLADTTQTPVIMVLNARGMSRSAVAALKGFLDYQSPNHIRGVILNQISGMLYPELKQMLEAELGVTVYGYVPRVTDCVIESRHLGLVTPGEIDGLRERLNRLADLMEDTVDLDGILDLAGSAPELDVQMPETLRNLLPAENGEISREEKPVRIGVARDEAFCFYYEDNLQLLRELGAELVEFSPLHDRRLPENLQGILLGGGYPELYAGALSENKSFIGSLQKQVAEGIPYLAECGGFMYLHEQMEDMECQPWPMAGIVPGYVKKTEKLGRFGYITLTANEDTLFGAEGTQIAGHEFHYFDSTNNGTSFHAQKPLRKRSWDCMLTGENFAVGFPHLYYYANPAFASQFVEACRCYARSRTERKKK